MAHQPPSLPCWALLVACLPLLGPEQDGVKRNTLFPVAVAGRDQGGYMYYSILFVFYRLFALAVGAAIPGAALIWDSKTGLGTGDELLVQGYVRGRRTYPLKDLREIQVIRATPTSLERALYRAQRAGWVRYNLVFTAGTVELPKSLGDSVVELVHERDPWIPILERDESHRVGVARPVYDKAGWAQLLADTDELPLETRKWIRNDLASRQPPGRLLAGLIGTLAGNSDQSDEPAALLIYPEVILATSGYGIGQSSYLRRGSNHVIDTVTKEGLVVEVTSLNFHIVELAPPAQTSAALQALQSLPWIKVREQPVVDS
jgi:hypothetical protein